VVPVHTGLATSDYGIHEVGSVFVESSRHSISEKVRNIVDEFGIRKQLNRVMQ
jgi:hypothetical protein